MPKRCCVPMCRSNYDGTDEKVSVFKFPKEKARADLWLRRIHRANFHPTKSSVVCAKHFENYFVIKEDSVTRDDGSILTLPRRAPKLRNDSVPTIFQHQPKYMSCYTPKPRTHPEERAKKRELELMKQEERRLKLDVIQDFVSLQQTIHMGEKPYECNECNYKAVRSTDLTLHMRTHTGEKRFSCNSCEYKCATKTMLTKHLRIHTGEKPFVCTMCDYKSASKTNLMHHMRTHTGEKPFACYLCDYKSSAKEMIRRHLRTHTGEKRYGCFVCGHKCATKSMLKRHLATHTGEKPFACDLCSYKTSYKSYLKIHMRVHTDENPFPCNLCNYRAKANCRLKVHMKLHAGEESFSCEFCEFKSVDKWSFTLHTEAHVEKQYVDNFVNVKVEPEEPQLSKEIVEKHVENIKIEEVTVKEEIV